jgi:hypothetical protein
MMIFISDLAIFFPGLAKPMFVLFIAELLMVKKNESIPAGKSHALKRGNAIRPSFQPMFYYWSSTCAEAGFGVRNPNCGTNPLRTLSDISNIDI